MFRPQHLIPPQKTLAAFVSLAVIASTAGCSVSSVFHIKPATPAIVGTWKGTDHGLTDTFVFRANGTFTETIITEDQDKVVDAGTYHVSGNSLSRTETSAIVNGRNIQTKSGTVPYSIDGDTMTFEIPFSAPLTRQK